MQMAALSGNKGHGPGRETNDAGANVRREDQYREPIQYSAGPRPEAPNLELSAIERRWSS